MVFYHKNIKVDLTYPKATGNVGKKIGKGRFYEKIFLEYIAKQRIEGVYVDVGANIGNHSTFFGLFTNSNKVLSFEPHPKIYKYLKDNIRRNHLGRKVITHHAALGAVNGKCSIEVDESDLIGGSKVKKGNEIDQWKLDNFIEHDIKLIKIDVEGYEEFVIKGSTRVLKKHKPELFIELTNKKQYKDVYGILQKYGYKPIAVFNNSATYHFSADRKQKLFNKASYFYPIRRTLLHS